MNANMPNKSYSSRTCAEKVSVSYKWELCNWSLLSHFYKNGVKSPQFKLTEALDCELEFKWNGSKKHEKDYASLTVKFLNYVKIYGIEIVVSFLDEHREKLKTLHTRCYKDIEDCRSIKLDDFLQTSQSAYLQNDTLRFFVEITIAEAVRTDPADHFSITVDRTVVLKSSPK